MRAIVVAVMMVVSGAAWGQDETWSCTTGDMRVCGQDGKCTKAESSVRFVISTSAGAGGVEFCPPKTGCRDFGELTIEQSGKERLLKGKTAGFTAFIGSANQFQASGRFRSKEKPFTFAASGKCTVSAKSVKAEKSIQHTSDLALRDGRAAQFPSRFAKVFASGSLQCLSPAGDLPCRLYSASIPAVQPFRANIRFGYSGNEIGTSVSLVVPEVRNLTFAQSNEVRGTLELLVRAADEDLTLTTLYMPSCQYRRQEIISGGSLTEFPMTDGGCEITVQAN